MSAASLMLTELEVVDVLFSASLMLQRIVMLGLRIVAGDDATVFVPSSRSHANSSGSFEFF